MRSISRITDKLKKTPRAIWLLMAYDVIAVMASYFLALWIRFDCQFSKIPEEYMSAYLGFIGWYVLLCIMVFWLAHLYNSIWEYASYVELGRIVIASLITSLLHIALITVLFRRMPITYYLFGMMIQFLALTGVRFSYRFVLLERSKRDTVQTVRKHVLIIGAGSAGRMILRDVRRELYDKEVVCGFIDDDPMKQGRSLDGVPILGGRNDILYLTDQCHIQKIYVAIPAASAEQRRDILNICKETGCELKNLPGVYQIMNGDVDVSKMRSVSVEDLLGREPIQVNMDDIYQQIQGKTILVTGGGGSIGSELCRQIAAHDPKLLIIFEVYENNAYDIQQELKKKYPKLPLVTLIGSVRDSRAIYGVFERYRPDIVYHAAAHKHVPLMEDSPCEAIKNNTIGTYKTAYAAMMHGCKRFVLISTDKAVNPTNIMGASKRLCEMVVQSFDAMIKQGRTSEIPELYIHSFPEDYEAKRMAKMPKIVRTEYVAVRFGNVLGSNGSVIPLFKKQIAEGGPVTVTHPDIIRYFMTIPEAVSLVMQAGTYAKGGEIFVLDMGEPVKIDDLARNLIKLSGYKPDVDIKVEYTGLRPGEKLYEEKLMAEEGLRTTKNKLIHIGCPIPFDVEVFFEQLQELMEVSYRNDEEIREYVMKVVSTYHPAGVC